MNKTIIGTLIIVNFIALSLSAGEIDLNYIIKGVSRQVKRINDEIKDKVYTAKSFSLQKDSKGNVKKRIYSSRRVYQKADDKTYDEYISMNINDKELSPAEMKKEIKAQRRKKRQQTKSPFSIEMIDSYRYKLAGENKIDDNELWIVSFEPKEEIEGFIKGKAYISKHHFNIMKMEFIPTGLPTVVREAAMNMTFSEVQGYWLPLKFKMSMSIKVKFILSLADIRLIVEDEYSDYKINTGLKDSFFKDKTAK